MFHMHRHKNFIFQINKIQIQYSLNKQAKADSMAKASEQGVMGRHADLFQYKWIYLSAADPNLLLSLF